MWSATIPFKPVPAPRPSLRSNVKNKKEQNGKNVARRISTYYGQQYVEYLEKVQDYLMKYELITPEFLEVANDPMGAILEVDFFYQIPKSYKRVYNIMKTTAPDIDNLLKAIMDALFNLVDINDSRISGVIAFKYNVAENARTEVRLKKYSEVMFKTDVADRGNQWEIKFPFKPVATPRPKGRARENGKVITYYPKEYREYLDRLRAYVADQGLINDQFYEVVKSPMGVIAEVDFFYSVSKNTKKLPGLMHTVKPDIDNLVKGVLDGIFTKDMSVRDSRIVGLIAFKYNTFDMPRTEVRLRGM